MGERVSDLCRERGSKFVSPLFGAFLLHMLSLAKERDGHFNFTLGLREDEKEQLIQVSSYNTRHVAETLVLQMTVDRLLQPDSAEDPTLETLRMQVQHISLQRLLLLMHVCMLQFCLCTCEWTGLF